MQREFLIQILFTVSRKESGKILVRDGLAGRGAKLFFVYFLSEGRKNNIGARTQ